MINPRNRIYNLKYILLLLIAGALCACDKQTVYHAFQSIPQEGWQKQDTLLFDVLVPDSQTYYKLSIEVRNRNDYPYQNLNLSVCYQDPDTTNLPACTLKTTLATPEGVWTGKGWSGLFQSSFPAGSIRIKSPGHYRFKVTHTLPDQVLTGIHDVGIRLRR